MQTTVPIAKNNSWEFGVLAPPPPPPAEQESLSPASLQRGVRYFFIFIFSFLQALQGRGGGTGTSLVLVTTEKVAIFASKVASILKQLKGW